MRRVQKPTVGSSGYQDQHVVVGSVITIWSSSAAEPAATQSAKAASPSGGRRLGPDGHLGVRSALDDPGRHVVTHADVAHDVADPPVPAPRHRPVGVGGQRGQGPLRLVPDDGGVVDGHPRPYVALRGSSPWTPMPRTSATRLLS